MDGDLTMDVDLTPVHIEPVLPDEGVVVLAQGMERELVREVDGARSLRARLGESREFGLGEAPRTLM